MGVQGQARRYGRRWERVSATAHRRLGRIAPVMDVQSPCLAAAARSKKLVLAREDLGDRVVGEDAADRVGEGAGGREHGDVVWRAGTQRDRVADDDLLDVGVLV